MAVERAGPLPTADLLVDIARDQALSARGSETAADVTQIELLLQAALRLDPQQVSAHRYLEELALWRGDTAAARSHLEAIVQLDPAHQGAFARWLETGLAGIQTAEARKQWLVALLSVSPPRPRDQQAMIYVHLARLALESMQRAQARLALDRALGLDEQNPDAAMLSLELFSADAPPAAQLKTILRALRASPLRTDLAAQAATLLDAYGFAAEAAVLFDHVTETAQSRGAALTAAFLYERARNLVAIRRWPDATVALDQVIRASPDLLEAQFLQVWLLTRMNRAAEAEALKAVLARRFAEIREPADWDVNAVAQAAWFYCTLDPQPQRALMLAESAARRAEKDTFAQRVLGWAQALSLRGEEAQATLMPIAGRDPFACYQLARLLRDSGDAEAPQRLIANLEFVPVGGPAYELLAELGPLGPATQPAGRRLPELAELFADFDREMLNFQKGVSRFLDAEVRIENPSAAVGEPWWATLSLTNRGRFPITLGADGMVNPVFALSFKLEGDRTREYANLITESLDRVRVLAPGQTVRIRRTLDIGPPGRAAKQTPQQLQRISVNAILDPAVDPQGNVVPAVTGQRLRPVFFNRVPATTNREAMHALFAALASPSDAARFQAIEIMAQLLGEHYRHELKQLNYRPSPIPADQIYQALSNALGAESWELRARTLHALSFAGLDANLARGVQACLDDPNWLVRLMALRLLARQGPSFASVCEEMAQEDTEELVRDMARSYLAAWGVEPKAAQSQPTFVPEPTGLPPSAVPPTPPVTPPPGGRNPAPPPLPGTVPITPVPRSDPGARPPPARPLPAVDPDLGGAIAPPRPASQPGRAN